MFVSAAVSKQGTCATRSHTSHPRSPTRPRSRITPRARMIGPTQIRWPSAALIGPLRNIRAKSHGAADGHLIWVGPIIRARGVIRLLGRVGDRGCDVWLRVAQVPCL